MTSYDYLFKRAKNVLKTRYDIELTESRWNSIEPFLQAQLLNILNKEKVQTEEIKYFLELLKRQNPTKFYLLELDLIKEVRSDYKKNQAPLVRNTRTTEITITDTTKRKDDSDHDDTAGYIYR